MTPASLSISFGGSLAVALLLILILSASAVLFYRFTLPPLPAAKRVILSLLRALAFSIMLMILFEPVARLVSTNDQQPTVAVLIDDSKSMTIKDASADRSVAVRKYLGERHFDRLAPEVRPLYFAFSSKLQSIPDARLDSIAFQGEATDLADVFVRLKDELAKQHIQAAVLVTDGNYTVGKNPVYDAEALGIPISTIGVGDTSEQKDILVEKVIANEIAYAGTRVPIDVTVKSSGFNGEKVEVMVSEGNIILDRKMLTLQEGTREYQLKLHAEPKEEGAKRYTISVSKLPGEIVEKNNTKSIFVKVLRNKLQILLLAGSPSPDVSAIRQVLIEDSRFTVKALVQKSANEFYEGTLSSSSIDSADCLVLIGFPSPATGAAVLLQVRDAAGQKRKPLLFINGKNTDYGKLQQLEPFLPITWTAMGSQEVSIFPSVNERQKTNSLITLEGNASVETWQQLPPIFKSSTSFHAKPESDVLASAKFQNITLDEPLVATRNVNGQKSFAVTGYGIWRWRLMTQGDPHTEQFLSFLLANAVRWLTTQEDAKGVRIVATKSVYTTTEPVEFTGQVYDNQFHPVENAEVRVELQRGNERLDVLLNSLGNGRYEGGTEGLGEGEYTFVGRASSEGKVYGEDKGKFSVGETNAEFLDTRMNQQLLEQIAFRTGGNYYPISGASDIAADLKRDVTFVPKEQVQTSEIELWNWQYLATLLIILLVTEWFLRKWAGML